MPDKHFNPDSIKKKSIAQATHGVMITSFLRQNDAATSFWRDNAAIFTSYVRWGCHQQNKTTCIYISRFYSHYT